MLAKDIMTHQVVTVTPDMLVPEVARLLIENRVSGLPVVNADHELIGIVSEGDLISKEASLKTPPILSLLGGFIYLESPNRFETELRKVTAVKVKDLMTRKVIAVSEDTPVSEVASIMVEKRINRVPVLRHKKLVGIITRADIVQSFLAGE